MAKSNKKQTGANVAPNPQTPNTPITAPVRYKVFGTYSAAAIARYCLSNGFSVVQAQAAIAANATPKNVIVSVGMLRTIAKNVAKGTLRKCGVPKLSAANVKALQAARKKFIAAQATTTTTTTS